jgi:hypothetical protein
MSRDINRSRIIDKNWQKLFDKYSILDKIRSNGFFKITSKEINEFKEARLMTKFDHRDNLPDLFYENKLSILPITRGNYIIGQFEAYKEINYNTKIDTKKIEFPSWIETVDYTNLYSEASVISCAFASGILQDVMEDNCILPTVNGRMSTQEFNFKIKSSIDSQFKNIFVKNSQCEIDGGYEGINKLMILEAKNCSAKDFLVRQLYYPYRLWSGKVTKEVVPVFLTYSNNIFSFFVYKFVDPLKYNSLTLVKQKNYVIDEANISNEDIQEVFNKVILAKEPDCPFPQANSIERVIDLMGALTIKSLSIDEITTLYSFNQRQAQYYSRAGIYLGLITDKNRGTASLTQLGKAIMKQRTKQKYLSIVERILQHKIFYETLKLYFKKCAPPTTEETYNIMKNNFVKDVNSAKTLKRRAGSVNRWIQWILNLSTE